LYFLQVLTWWIMPSIECKRSAKPLTFRGILASA
jgi:hypothetical protein